MAIDLAVMLADGGTAIADLALLRDQREVFGPVASTSPLDASWPTSTPPHSRH